MRTNSKKLVAAVALTLCATLGVALPAGGASSDQAVGRSWCC